MSEETLEIGIYYYIDEETGKKVYDEDEMRDEFERKLKELLNQKTKTKISEETLEIGVYYYIDEETEEKVYDTEEMRDEFEFKLDRL